MSIHLDQGQPFFVNVGSPFHVRAIRALVSLLLEIALLWAGGGGISCCLLDILLLLLLEKIGPETDQVLLYSLFLHDLLGLLQLDRCSC